MASIDLVQTWITLADDTSQSVVVRRTQGARNTTLAGDVRQYASGRLRAVTRSAKPGTVTLAFRTKDPTIVDTLRSWLGRTVLIRDPRGRADWCVFLSIDETDSAPNWTEVQLPLSYVTHTAEV